MTSYCDFYLNQKPTHMFIFILNGEPNLTYKT